MTKEEFLQNRKLEWLQERSEELRSGAKARWKEQEAGHESEWEAYVKDNEGALLKAFATLEAAEQVRVRRHWNDWKVGRVPLVGLSGLHWDSVSG